MVNRLVIAYSCLYDFIFKNRAKPPAGKLDPDHASLNGSCCTVNGPLQPVNRDSSCVLNDRYMGLQHRKKKSVERGIVL